MFIRTARSSGLSSTEGYPNKRARTRAALIRGAMEVLGADGAEGLTVAAVTQAAGVSHGTLYNHVDGTAELEQLVADELVSVFARGAEHLERVSVDPVGRIGLGIIQLLSTVDTDPVFAAAFVTLMTGGTTFRDRIRALVASTVRRGAENGRFDVEPEAATEALLGATLGTLRAAVNQTYVVDPKVSADLCLRMLGLDDEARDQALRRATAAQAAPR